MLGRALSGLGDHDDALPLLAQAGAEDESSMAALLRSTGAVRGAASALDAYERHRADLAERLGVDPGPALQALHAELLAADRPVRAGLRFAATSLVGRDDDIRALRAMVRQARVTSILGPGGLGKTRLAHLLGQEAEQPIVHFVELVGVSSPEDVVSEVGSALGVRDSVSGRRVLTAEQRGDVRARIGQALDQAPTLLILDNCEHVVAAVADLVAYLVATCRRLSVVTTTRAPLAIVAERVFPLGQLSEDAAADLFRQRASAARPGLALDDDAVRRVVRRLDGLPLAIELAAAKVRVMSVGDIDRRLDDRFALLRGGDRSAPDRHQTLLAVIDWSWNLLTEAERRALRWLAVFHDGFTLAAADAVLGHDALDEIQSLVDQSLLTVLDADGHGPLPDAGDGPRVRPDAAGRRRGGRRRPRRPARLGPRVRRRQRRGALDGAPGRGDPRAAGRGEQPGRLPPRGGLVPDPWTTAQLMAALGGFWTVKGENPRVISMTGAVEDALRGWRPEPDEIDIAVSAAALTVMNTVSGEIVDAEVCTAILAEYGARATTPRVRGMVEVLRAQDLADIPGTVARLDAIGDGPDREAATLARMWAAHYRENDGDPEGAMEEVERGLALVRGDDGPWIGALLHTLLAGLNAQLGNHEDAAVHALAALPVLDRLEANDDAIQVRSLLAVSAMTNGDADRAEQYLVEIDQISGRRAGFGGAFVTGLARAELSLVRGDVPEGLRLYRIAVQDLRDIQFPGMVDPTGLEPWALFGESAPTTAFAVHGSGTDGVDLYECLGRKVRGVLDPDRPHMDYPVAGLVLYGLGPGACSRTRCRSRTPSASSCSPTCSPTPATRSR